MGETPNGVYICKNCESMFFNQSDVMAHKAMTGHYQFEKRNGQKQSNGKRNDILKELEGLGIPLRALDRVSDAALKELLEAIKKAKGMTEKKA